MTKSMLLTVTSIVLTYMTVIVQMHGESKTFNQNLLQNVAATRPGVNEF